MKMGRLSLITLMLGMLLPLPCRADRRVALVLGNGAYTNARALDNPVKDAQAMAEKLRAMRFDVEVALDQGKLGMERALRAFNRKLEGADLALLFYAGHGLQVGDRNYLLPVDAKLEREADLDYETLEVQRLLEPVQTLAKVGIVFLDACRDNPLARRMKASTRALTQGLRPMSIDSGEVLIAYATSPDRVAADGTGEHSPFTRALLDHMGAPGLEVQIMLKRVARSVEQSTAGKQIPWQHSSLRSEVYLADVPTAPAAPLRLAPPPQAAPVAAVPRAPAAGRPPIYKRWWFWGAVGLVTAGVVVGAAVGGARASAAEDVLAGVSDGSRRDVRF